MIASHPSSFRASRVLSLVLLALLGRFFMCEAGAQTFTVTTNADSGPGSLRDAVAQANTAGGGTVNVPSSLGTIEVTGNEITILEPIHVVGTGADLATIDAGGQERIFFVASATTGVRFENLVLTGGMASSGAAIKVFTGASVEVERCAITGNTALSRGAGISCEGGTLSVNNSSFTNNVVQEGSGGGIEFREAAGAVTNSTFAHNTAAIGGAGISFFESNVDLEHVTITANTVDPELTYSGDGGGLNSSSGNTITVVNSIIAGNLDANPDPSDRPDVSGSFLSLGYNLIGIAAGSGSFTQIGDQAGTAAMPLDPKLLQCHTPEPVPLFYTLAPDSPALDAGNSSAAGIAALDQRGYDRVFGISTDIGATELDLYLVQNALASGINSLRDRIGTAALAGHGTIAFTTATVFSTPQTIPTGPMGAIDIDLPGNLTILGPSDPGQHVTIDAVGSDRIFNAVNGDIVLKDLTLTGGDTTTNPVNDPSGGAILARGGDLTLIKCTIDNNVAAFAGGGIYLSAGQLTVRDSTFSNNTAQGGSGGGIYDALGDGISIFGSTFNDNVCDGDGGGVRTRLLATLQNSTFSGNRARGSGGGIAVPNASGALIMDFCTVTLNTADNDNDGTGEGGGIYSLSTSIETDIGRSIIAENTDKSGTAADYSGDFGALIFCLLGDDTGGTGVLQPGSLNLSGTGGAALDPQLRPLEDNGGCTQTHALRWNSPAFNGTPLPVDESSELRLDQRGINVRGENGLPDIGAYELTYLISVSNEASLRDAIEQVNEDGDGIVRVGSTAVSKETVTLTSPLTVSGNLCLSGPTGPGQGFTISGGDAVRVFDIANDGGEVVFENLTIADGNAGNQDGGGIFASLTCDVIIRRCTISGCSAASGGGLYLVNSGQVLIDNSTISGNAATGSGGGAFGLAPDLVVRSSTIAGNICDANFDDAGDGGGIYLAGGTAALRNTLVATNLDASPSGIVQPDLGTLLAFTSQGHNVIGSALGATGFTDGVNDDQVSVASPLIGPLADNGGPTETHALLDGSPAIDAGVAATSAETDQRGVLRVINGAADVGAYESYVSYADCIISALPPGTSPMKRAPRFDFDRDGLANGIEFLIGSDPAVPDNTGQVTAHVEGTDLVVEFPLSLKIDPAQAVVVHSTDFGVTDPWESTGVVFENQGELTATTDLIFASIPIGAETALFGRLVFEP